MPSRRNSVTSFRKAPELNRVNGGIQDGLADVITPATAGSPEGEPRLTARMASAACRVDAALRSYRAWWPTERAITRCGSHR